MMLPCDSLEVTGSYRLTASLYQVIRLNDKVEWLGMAIWNVAYCLIVRNSLKHSVIIIRINNHIFDLQLILYSTYKMQLPWPFDSNQFYSNCIPKELKNYYLELLCNSYYLHLEINHNNLTTSSFCPDLELRPLLQMEGLNAFLL